MELHPDVATLRHPGPHVRLTEDEKHLWHHHRVDERLDAYKAIKGRSGTATVKRREASKHAWWALTGHLRWPHRSKASFLFKTYKEVAELHRQLHESKEGEEQ
jgi:hypothetical protein